VRAAWCALALAACSGPRGAFECTDNASCRNGAVTGTCESTGFCSFPDPTCPMGSRYGNAAGNGLAGLCVGQIPGDGSGSGSDANDTTPPHALGAWDNSTAITAPRYTHATAVDGNYFYVIGGILGPTGHADVWFATTNPSAVVPSAVVPIWTQTTPLPAGRWTFGAAYDAGYLYVFGGRTSAMGTTTDVLSTPVNTDGTLGTTWTATTALPQSIKCEAVASSGANVYVIGGKHTTTSQALVFRSTMSGGSVSAWQVAATLDETVFNHAAVAANGYLYVIGGCVSGSNGCSKVLDVVEVAKINSDGSLGTFAHTTALPTARWHHTAAASANGDIYVLGGMYGSAFGDPSTSDVIGAHIHADGSLGAWHTMQSLLTSRVRGTSAVIGSYLIFVQAETQVAQIQ
jgi:hypothetical protein